MAVYTRLTKEEIANHLNENYDIGQLQDFSEIIAGIDNSNFIITTDQKYILTIFESRIKEQELPFFINFKSHLASHNICCPKPILNKQNSTITKIKNKNSAIVTFLSGKTLEPRADGYYDNISLKHCFEVGKVTANLHLKAKDFKQKRHNDLGVSGFKTLLNKFSHLVNDYQENLLSEITQIIDFLEISWQNNLQSCPAHLDLFPDNVFFNDNHDLSGVIDFYFAANDLMIYDFAIITNAWCFDENNQFDKQKFQQMLNGYESLRPFSKAEKDFLNIALIAASMRFLLTRLHDLFFTPKDSLVNVKDPGEYITKLRFFKDRYDN